MLYIMRWRLKLTVISTGFNLTVKKIKVTVILCFTIGSLNLIASFYEILYMLKFQLFLVIAALYPSAVTYLAT